MEPRNLRVTMCFLVSVYMKQMTSLLVDKVMQVQQGITQPLVQQLADNCQATDVVHQIPTKWTGLKRGARKREEEGERKRERGRGREREEEGGRGREENDVAKLEGEDEQRERERERFFSGDGSNKEYKWKRGVEVRK
ncbi:hypothetical protein DPEC_G00235650 [Dallia pectoralis]|uniref:Uncharacterized protein n=1 Tax=Dallia pectoralis TaxID=75939 RepID=A0ACC2FY71_DALPE|nr:hypothetical protein DPEC_G00235650 [Dallia pectoralis]